MIYTCYKKIDELGRVVLPKEIREKLDIAPKDMLKIDIEDERVVITKAEETCVFCGKTGALKAFKGKNVCEACIKSLNKY